MEYKAYYIYNNKKTPILIKNDSVNLSFKMEGIEFSGSEFSDFSTKDEISDKIKDDFEFWEIPILGQDKVQRTLCDCSFNIFVPQIIIASESQNEFECVLTINYILGKERPKPKGGLEEERVDLSIIVNGQEYKGSGDFFEIALDKINAEFNGKYTFKNCYGCLFSDYSIYGQNSFGGMRCFVESKDAYLDFTDKGTYSKITNYKDVQEIYVCNKYTKRIRGTGYRG